MFAIVADEDITDVVSVTAELRDTCTAAWIPHSDYTLW